MILKSYLSTLRGISFLILSMKIRNSNIPYFTLIGLLVQPFTAVIGFLLIRVFLRFQSNEVQGLNVILFFGTACITFFMFKRMALTALQGIPSYLKNILTIRHIKPIDLFISSALVDLRIYGFCMVILLFSVWYYEWHIGYVNPTQGILAFVLAVITALGVSLVTFQIGQRLPIFKQIVKIFLRRILFWTSGLFFTSVSLPHRIRQIFLINPLLHAIELIRNSLDVNYSIPDISLFYLFLWALISFGFGLLLFSLNDPPSSLLLSTQDKMEEY